MKAVSEPKSSLHFETKKVQAAFSCADFAAAGLLTCLQTLPQARLQFHHFG